MKKFYIGAAFFIFLSLLCASAFAETQVAGERPGLRFDERDVQLPEVIQGESIQHTFRVFNDGKMPLVIEKVQPG